MGTNVLLVGIHCLTTTYLGKTPEELGLQMSFDEDTINIEASEQAQILSLSLYKFLDLVLKKNEEGRINRYNDGELILTLDDLACEFAIEDLKKVVESASDSSKRALKHQLYILETHPENTAPAFEFDADGNLVIGVKLNYVDISEVPPELAELALRRGKNGVDIEQAATHIEVTVNGSRALGALASLTERLKDIKDAAALARPAGARVAIGEFTEDLSRADEPGNGLALVAGR